MLDFKFDFIHFSQAETDKIEATADSFHPVLNELRNTFDLSAVALARELSHLPVIADPSHGTGRRSSLIPIMSRAAIGAGADGLIIEVHPCPERALSDGQQSLDLHGFEELMRGLKEPARELAGTT